MIDQNPNDRPVIFIATPCYGGLVPQEYVLSILELVSYAATRGLEMVFALQGHDSLITRSRNTLVSHFLQTTATHLIFIDADIGFQPKQLEQMLAFDQEVVCGVYPLKVRDSGQKTHEQMQSGEPWETASLRYVGLPCDPHELERRGSFVTGQYAGCGFMLIKRSAVERMILSYPETAYRASHCYTNAKAERTYALFESEIDHDEGIYLSEDFAFCRRFRAIGGKIWLDTAGRLTHVGSHSFVGAPAIRFAAHTAATDKGHGARVA